MIKEKSNKQLTSLLPTNNAYLNNNVIIRSYIVHQHGNEFDDDR
ncbi:Hypoticical protein [Pectobacterium parmentieri]|uniref:Hypoticical protein n=1 Tax=Pectobacterium parmentieri TaxID=1905730 RepID=A0A0H3I8G5_PECPM|nr:Hypoticical protein [Pectobacterium parmentieri]